MRETKKKQREREEEKARGVAAVDGGSGYSGGFCPPPPFLLYLLCSHGRRGSGGTVTRVRNDIFHRAACFQLLFQRKFANGSPLSPTVHGYTRWLRYCRDFFPRHRNEERMPWRVSRARALWDFTRWFVGTACFLPNANDSAKRGPTSKRSMRMSALVLLGPGYKIISSLRHEQRIWLFLASWNFQIARYRVYNSDRVDSLISILSGRRVRSIANDAS